MPVDNKVSIIIPLYNKEKVIRQTLKSVLEQSYTNWECIIVDDGSTDSSLSVVNKYVSENAGNWKVVEQENQGQAVARNRGISESSGRFLAFLDADDLWTTHKLESQVKVLSEDLSTAIVFSAYAIFSDSRKGFRVVQHRSAKEMMDGWMDMSGFGGGLESVGLVRAENLKEVGGFDLSLSTSSGLDFAAKISTSGQIVVLPDIGFLYRLSETQWHKDVAELKRNILILEDRYSSIYQGDLTRSHAAYIFWMQVRQSGRFNTLQEFVKSFFSLPNGRLLMFYKLVKRNLLSKFRGYIHRAELGRTLERLSEIRS